MIVKVKEPAEKGAFLSLIGNLAYTVSRLEGYHDLCGFAD